MSEAATEAPNRISLLRIFKAIGPAMIVLLATNPAVAGPKDTSDKILGGLLVLTAVKRASHAVKALSSLPHMTEGTSQAFKQSTEQTTYGPPKETSDRITAETMVHPMLGSLLLQEAYQRTGPNLNLFAEHLTITPGQLATAIVQSMPTAPSSTDYSKIMAYTVPVLERRQLNQRPADG